MPEYDANCTNFESLGSFLAGPKISSTDLGTEYESMGCIFHIRP